MAQNYVLLERIELNASAASVTFSNIPQSGYTDLKVVWSGRLSDASTATYCKLTFNGSAANFTAKRLAGSGSAATSGNLPQWSGTAPGTNATSNTFSNVEFYIPNYTSSNYKSYSLDTVTENNATEAYAELGAGLWSDTAAITSITLTGNAGSFLQYSTFSLYGLAAVGTTPVIAPKASGGNITTDGTYWIHTFLTSGTFTPATNLSCDYLVVAGGGGGGNGGGGGGGAGGYLTATGLSISTSLTVTVGAGGAGKAGGSEGIGTQGSASVLDSISATGGGYGSSSVTSGGNGGSGGGGGSNSGGTGVSGQGNNGGTGSSSGPNYGSGGGGGKNAVGGAGTGTTGGTGGAGLASSYSGASVTYAGGGGGGTYQGTAGAGGAGGGGAGGAGGGNNSGIAGTVNTGGGGGGGTYQTSAAAAGGAGGSGIVIIRYLVA